VAVEVDLDALVERELETRGDKRAEIRLQRFHATRLVLVGGRRHQEIDGDVEVAHAPALERRVVVGVRVGLEALGVQPGAQLGVTLVVEQGEHEPDVEVIGARVPVVVAIVLALRLDTRPTAVRPSSTGRRSDQVSRTSCGVVTAPTTYCRIRSAPRGSSCSDPGPEGRRTEPSQ
jgi:hypothetical protein